MDQNLKCEIKENCSIPNVSVIWVGLGNDNHKCRDMRTGRPPRTVAQYSDILDKEMVHK